MTTVMMDATRPGLDPSVMECAKDGLIEAVVPFGGSSVPVQNPNKHILGGKGLGLQEMGSIGIAVPPGFTLTTPLCQVYQQTHDLPFEMWDEVKKAITRLENDMGKKFGDATNPLLLSCRSGAAKSMPGMMDTVLNIGLNDETVKGLALATGNPRFAYDSFRRLLDMFGDVVLGIPHEDFEEKHDALKKKYGATTDLELDADHLMELCQAYYQVYKDKGMDFPQDPFEQIQKCIRAVFGSWNSSRAVKYRKLNNITSLLGTATNVQTMVFGNLGSNSGTGVAFSRDPGTGEAKLKGEYLINAQGEDVVAGIRTPEPISTMERNLPEAYKEFIKNVNALERHFKDMQDVEFTVQEGKLWMLQCRSGKRTGHAAIKIAIDLVNEGICNREEALLNVEPDHVKQVLHPTFPQIVLNSPQYKDNVIAVGLQGGPGAAVGKLCFHTEEAEARSSEDLILVRENTSPEDVGGMWASKGILTSRGGVTSHAAVVARSWGKPCVCGCHDLEIDVQNKTMTVKSTGEIFKAGDVVSINGSTGEVIRCAIPTESPTVDGDFGTLLGWADAVDDSCKVMTNADSGPDSAKAAELGAKGIGLTRTEHMFFDHARLPHVRAWILHGVGIEKLREFQRSDFREIFKAMDGKPVTVRLLDPPLHEFTPPLASVNENMARELGYDDVHHLKLDIEKMHEENPMLGLRGCRLGICRPELTAMQVEAIMNAAADNIEADSKANPFPRIMIPLVGNVREFEHQALLVKRTAEQVKTERNMNLRYEIGTMIEVPNAALQSDKIAATRDPETGDFLCKFFSFGTNDLTQMTLGISRDDAGEFIPKYNELGIFKEDPFKNLDADGVGWLLRLSAAKGRSVNPSLSLSVCGEHGGDAASIEFFDDVGLDYVSCSPFRVPVARLASAQAALKRKAAGRTELKQQRVLSFRPAL